MHIIMLIRGQLEGPFLAGSQASHYVSRQVTTAICYDVIFFN